MLMNRKNVARTTKNFLLSLLAFSALGVVSLPAKADDAIIQDSYQETIQTGDGNVSIQESYQESHINRHKNRHQSEVDTGVVQSNRQSCDQYGVSNLCAQTTDQRSNIRHNVRHRGRY
ncbi:hypothetical protein PCC7418_0810 [Halothece sp. PCC 7418]|uniref:hypothetical protein n=1 Tax=Halothece sp. (strain PCC 7418) TaxID=65093 RepID=UPI0002A07AD5|nr:hypothetical protein [Halothece sp. PCC 7418]AFZ43025.1 hypothetical protein PCC7418_0810 [Halothece sp. PCC 7418]